MSRDQKIQKLARAIRTYRGGYIPESGQWKYQPQPQYWAHVRLWLDRLGILTPENIDKITNGFKTVGEFEKWIKEL